MHRPTQTAADRVQAQQNIQEIVRLEERALNKRSLPERVAGRIAAVAASPWFVLVHLVFFATWIVLNTGSVAAVQPFDPYPFSFLTFILSMEAILLTLMVLMSQNRLMKQSEHRAHLDLQLNMLAEQESTATLRMVRRICEKLGLEAESDDAAQRLEQATDVREIAQKIEKELPK